MKIGPYEVLGELGRGGMGSVFRARSPAGDEVALKLIIRPNEAAVARFERERRLLSALGVEEGFVPLLDAGTTAQGPYIVMGLANGGTLRDRLERGPFSVEATVRLGRALASALGRAHERGIVHRDVKPENVLFSADGAPLVADLGLAKHFDREAKGASQSVALSRDGDFRGTAGYMPPEQAIDATAAGPPADVFAVGAILYECLAGKPAFSGDNVAELLVRLSAGKVEPLARVRPETPPWLVRVVERALAREAEDRFASGSALLDALHGRGGAGRAPWRRVVGGALVAAGATVTLVALVRGGRASPRGPDPRPDATASPSSGAAPVAPPVSPEAREAAAESVAALASALEQIPFDVAPERAAAAEAARRLGAVAGLPKSELAILLAPLDARVRELVSGSTVGNQDIVTHVARSLDQALAKIPPEKRTPLLQVARFFFGPHVAVRKDADVAASALRAFASGSADALLAGLAYDQAAEVVLRWHDPGPDEAKTAAELLALAFASLGALEAPEDREATVRSARRRLENVRDAHHVLAEHATSERERGEHARQAIEAAVAATRAPGHNTSTARTAFSCLLELDPTGKGVEDFLAANREALDDDMCRIEYVRVHDRDPERALALARVWRTANANDRLNLLALRTLVLLDLGRLVEARATVAELRATQEIGWHPYLEYLVLDEIERRVRVREAR